MSSEIKVSSVKAKDGTAGISIADSTGNVTASGTLTATGALTASGGIANAGTISAGTIGNNVTVQSSFGITDRTSLFVAQTGWTLAYQNMFSFNGIMFLSGRCHHGGGTPSTGEAMLYINNSDFHPINKYVLNTISHVGDYAQRIDIDTNGYLAIINPVQSPADTFFTLFNGFYRYA